MAVGNAVDAMRGAAHLLLLKVENSRDIANHADLVLITLFVFLVYACIVLGQLLKKNRWMSESITALLSGLCIGVIILIASKGQSSHVLKFDEELKLKNPRDIADHADLISITLFVSLLAACILLGQLLKKNRWMNVSITTLLLGLFIGVIVLIASKGQSSHVLKFNEEFFFNYLLPPIIFNAGFSMKKKQFFENFIAIMLFGVAGVFISLAIISTGAWWLFPKLGLDNLSIRDILAIGVIFSATDSVCTLQVLIQNETPFLYSLVFGEGVVNDATSVVLFRAVQTYNFDNFTLLEGFQIGGSFLYLFFLSCIMGIMLGLINSYIMKIVDFDRQSTQSEISFTIIMAYLPYLLAELFYLSGILSVFFCGIVMSHYTWHNITIHSRITTKNDFATMSFIAETFIFLYVGMDALDIDKWRMTQSSFLESFGLFGSLIILILLGRAAFVFPLSILSNYTTKSVGSKIGVRQMIIIWWAGLMRGAVSIALAFNQFTMDGNKSKTVQDASLITTTIPVVLASTIVFGTLTAPLIAWIYPPHHRSNFSVGLSPEVSLEGDYRLLIDDREQNEENEATKLFTGDLTRFQSFKNKLTTPMSTIHAVWRRFDDAYMKPTFVGRGYVGLESPPKEKAPLLEDKV